VPHHVDLEQLGQRQAAGEVITHVDPTYRDTETGFKSWAGERQRQQGMIA
jgi:hypothetical protein